MLFTLKMPQPALQECLAALREEILRPLVIGRGGRSQSCDYCSYLWHRSGPRKLPRTALPEIPIYFRAPHSAAQSRARLDEIIQPCPEPPEDEAGPLLPL